MVTISLMIKTRMMITMACQMLVIQIHAIPEFLGQEVRNRLARNLPDLSLRAVSHSLRVLPAQAIQIPSHPVQTVE